MGKFLLNTTYCDGKRLNTVQNLIYFHMEPKDPWLPVSVHGSAPAHLLYRSRYIIVIIFSALLLLTGCSKTGAIATLPTDIFQQFFEQNILNHDYKVKLATDSGVDNTYKYNGYIFRLIKNTDFDGPFTASNGLGSYTGTWSCNSDYSKLSVSLPSSPPEFIFLTRDWRFTKKDITIMEMAPWGTTDPKVLQMERQ